MPYTMFSRCISNYRLHNITPAGTTGGSSITHLNMWCTEICSAAHLWKRSKEINLLCKVLLLSWFKCTANFSLQPISVYSQFQCAANFSVHPISVCSQFQCTSNFSVQPISVYSQVQCTANFSVHPISVCSQFQCTSKEPPLLPGSMYLQYGIAFIHPQVTE